MADPLTLPSLTPREAVADALHRCVLGLDTNNRALFESGCLMDETMTLIAGPFGTLEGWAAASAIVLLLFDLVTMHTLSNIRVELQDGADTASLTAHAISYHIRPEEAHKPEDTSYTAGNLYYVDLVRDKGDGLWKIKKWDIRNLWVTGDRAVLEGGA
ncbi:hypothetical protein BDV95DRAFT_562383 [Massariosphaeria phaeospora]|uniref:SnoaL-like domain-containing protein n=1 Tax=Massariosphaeria phaeospora TaxID=100035 RepID=A0A7C8IF71_9PLEO|nr:hypothetical protein BDV95DRAFT_562383 [Massariosphaeria phaeospora]